MDTVEIPPKCQIQRLKSQLTLSLIDPYFDAV